MTAIDDHELKEISKPTKEEEEEEKEMSLWSELPLELVGKISQLAYTSDPSAIATMRVTCKSWSMINIMNFRYPLSPPSNQIEDHSYPYLLKLEDSTCKFVHPIYDHTFSLETSELSGARIRSSRFGWLLVTGRDSIHFFFNPFTRQKIDLPEITYGDYFSESPECILTMYFSAPPTCVDCYVIGMEENSVVILRPDSEYWESYIFNREENWKCHKIIPEHFKDYGLAGWISNCHPVILEEKGYFLGLDGRLIVFDFKTNKFSSIGEPFLKEEEVDSLYRSFLVKNGDQLMAIFEFEGEEKIGIARLKLSTEKKYWQPLTNLGNNTLYINLRTCFLMEASSRGTRNKIYFPKMRGKECIFFSLATKKFHSYSNTYSSKIPLGIKEFRNSVWFELLPYNEQI